MRLGVRGHDFGRLPEDVLAKTIKNAGFDCTQLAMTKAVEGVQTFSDITPEKIKRVKKAFAENELEISVFGCYIEPSILDNEQRQKNIRHFQNALAHANELGVPIVGTETTHFSGAEEKREECFKILCDSVYHMLKKAEQENVFVGIEPVAEHTLNTPALTKRLVDEMDSPFLKIVFDPVNLLLPHTAHQQTEIYQQLFDLVGDKIFVLHAKDVVMEQNEKVWTNIGNGIVDYPFLFQWLHKHKPDIRVLREHVKMDSYEKDREALKHFMER